MYQANEEELKILAYWQDKDIFQKTLAKPSPRGSFVFFEGPPTANGQPGMHHVEARAFKDVIPRFKTMQGYFVGRKAGWDTQGLPVELQIEKDLKISGKPQIEKYGVKEFNQKCRESVWHYLKDWEKLTERVAFWLDLKHPYITYENTYIESLWQIIKKIWDKGLLYEGHKVVPQCPRCGTALSSHEVALGYKSIEENSIFVKFRVKKAPAAWAKFAPLYILSWTTTPWTLPGNVALAVGGGIDYVLAQKEGEFFILAKALAEKVLQDNYEIMAEAKGKELEGLEYEPLFPGYLDADGKKAWYVAEADFVSTKDGTGVVHTAVMYGEDDYNLGEKIDLPKVHTVDESGLFLSSVKKWAGRFVKDVEADIINDLQERGLLHRVLSYIHDYPFCWRCGTPLLYYAKHSWFIKMSDPAVKEKLLNNAAAINWVPAYIKEGRFGEWLKEVKDWALSRERYWGTPLPVWRCERGHQEVMGSVADLEKASGRSLKDLDLHRPFVDAVEWPCQKCGGEMSRAPEVLDCWFDAGSMPFAQWHYPFENKEKIDKGEQFPASYIAEAIDQTRGWFYTLLAVSTLLGYGAPYKNVICLGHLRDDKGEKMSKSKGNIVFPWEVIEKYGADAARWYFYTINQPGDPKNFAWSDVEAVMKKFFLILYNVFTFYQLYAGSNAASIVIPSSAAAGEAKSPHILDRWILSKLALLTKETTAKLEAYDVVGAARGLADFVNELSTWYLRRSRDRFKGDDEADKQAALTTLREVLMTLSKLMAPFTPFIAEKIYLELDGGKESVHLEEWPMAEEKMIDEKVLAEMATARKIVEMGLAMRAEKGIKVRQPLSALRVIGGELSDALQQIVADELNVKKVETNKNGDVLSVELDATITPELKKEGLAREIVRVINQKRKETGLTIQDKVIVRYQTDDKLLLEVFTEFGSEIKKSVLAERLEEGEGEEIKVHEMRVRIGLEKIG